MLLVTVGNKNKINNSDKNNNRTIWMLKYLIRRATKKKKKKKNANQNNNKCRVGTASHTYSAILTPFGGNVVLFAF